MKRGFAVCAACAACVGSTAPRAQCIFDDDCEAGFACFAGACTPGRHLDGGLGWCPLLQPRLSDIDRRLFKVSCGAATNFCHNAEAASGFNVSSGLDFTGDPYPVLVNVRSLDSGGHPDGGVPVRVKPGDPDSSFLAIKLRLAVTQDAQFGSGMPPDHPGALCDEAQAAVRQWIAEGAQRN